MAGANSLALLPITAIEFDRRVYLSKHINILLSTTITSLDAASSDEGVSTLGGAHTAGDIVGGVRPARAPLQALLPVTRLKLWVDDVYEYTISRDCRQVDQNEQKLIIVQRINERLSNPPKLFRGEKFEKRTSQSTAQLTTGVSSANREQYQFNRKGLNFGEKMNAMINQADVERQWGMLQYAESKREEGNEMRMAFNYYTRQLSFADEYVLTASKEERKQLIRNDNLPSLTAVITSDLDRRDLYRNQFLTAIDDASAEAAYQVKQNMNDVETTDLIDLVGQAHDACDNWFSLIAPQDVKDAIQKVQLR